MKAAEFWTVVTKDESRFRDDLIDLLRREGVRFCVIGGQAVNAYVAPVVSLDLDLAVAVGQLEGLERFLRERYRVERYPFSLNVTSPGSDLRVQFQTDPRYAPFVDRAEERDVLGVRLPVAHVEDLLAGKVWAAMDQSRRASKRLKDLSDIMRLVESFPELRAQVPSGLLAQMPGE
jgi:hypothetical protein